MLANARPFIDSQIIFLLSIMVDAEIKQDRALSGQLVVGIITVSIDYAIGPVKVFLVPLLKYVYE